MRMTTMQFMKHVQEAHDFGTGHAQEDALGLSSPATRAYHRHLHETKPEEMDHEHKEEEL